MLSYQDGHLCIEGQPVGRLSDELGTPFFLVSEARLQANYHALAFASRFCAGRLLYPSLKKRPEAFLAFMLEHLRAERYDCFIPMSDEEGSREERRAVVTHDLLQEETLRHGDDGS